MSDFHSSKDKRPTFEETWPRYEFAEMVRIGLAIGDWIARLPPPPHRRHAQPSRAVAQDGTDRARNLTREGRAGLPRRQHRRFPWAGVRRVEADGVHHRVSQLTTQGTVACRVELP